MWLGILVAVLYGSVAVAANFVNKYAVQVLPLPSTILLIQAVTAVVVLRILAALRVFGLPSLRALRLRQLAPLAACYCVHAVLVLYSLAFLSVPMYNTLKRLTPVIVLSIKAATERRLPDTQTASSVLLIVSGCMVAGAGDLSFDGKGYTLATVCAVMQAAYILLAERAKSGSGAATSGQGGLAVSSRKKHSLVGTEPPDIEGKLTEGRGVSTVAGSLQPLAHSTCVEVHAQAASNRSLQTASAVSDPLCTNFSKAGGGSCCTPAPASHASALSSSGSTGDGGASLSALELLYSTFCIALPALTIICMISGEGARAPALLAALRASMGGPGFVAWLGVTAVVEGLLTGSLILCAQLNSALTTSIVGVLKGAVSSILGFFLLGGVRFHALNVLGITMNMVGGAWYSASQYLAVAR